MEEMMKTLPQHTCSWLKNNLTLYKYQNFWNIKEFIEGAIEAQNLFKTQPNDLFLCSAPKSGTTWLKALTFAIITRHKFDSSTSPLLTTMPHECFPLLEKDLQKIEENQKKNKTSSSCFPVATHLPYVSLPDSIRGSNCKIVYIYRNVKDVMVSDYHFARNIGRLSMQDAPFEEAFDDFCQGFSWCGPYWDHILGYWKASLEKPEMILLLKYEDMKKDPTSSVKKLAEFIGHPFTPEEEKAGVIESIVKLCSFESLSNLEVNKSGKHRAEETTAIDNRLYFRKAEDGDWKNYFTDEMIVRIDKLIDEKLSDTGLVLK